MGWKQEEINIGEIKVGSKQEIIFESLEQLPEIKSLTSSCGCSVPEIGEDNMTIEVIYTPKPVPQQRKEMGWYKTRKIITLVYEDNSKDFLAFNSIVKGNV